MPENIFKKREKLALGSRGNNIGSDQIDDGVFIFLAMHFNIGWGNSHGGNSHEKNKVRLFRLIIWPSWGLVNQNPLRCWLLHYYTITLLWFRGNGTSWLFSLSRLLLTVKKKRFKIEYIILHTKWKNIKILTPNYLKLGNTNGILTTVIFNQKLLF